MSFIYRYILRESCSQFDSLPLTYLTISDTGRAGSAPAAPKVRSAARASAARRRTSAQPRSRPSIVPPPRRAKARANDTATRGATPLVTALYDVVGEAREELSFAEGDRIEVEETVVPECVLCRSRSCRALLMCLEPPMTICVAHRAVVLRAPGAGVLRFVLRCLRFVCAERARAPRAPCVTAAHLALLLPLPLPLLLRPTPTARFGDGWWRGRNLASGARGVFPSNYVEAAAAIALFSARALYDCDGDGPGELTFSAGDVLGVTATNVPTQGDGWWLGALPGGAAGMFPSNYVDRIVAGNSGGRRRAKGKASTTSGGLFGGLLGGKQKKKKKKKADASADFEIGGFSDVSVRHVDLGGAAAGGARKKGADTKKRRKTKSGPPSLAPRRNKAGGTSRKQTAAETDASADGVDVDANSELAAMAREQAELEAIAEQRKMERKKANATKLEAKRLSLERARRAAAEAEAAADAEAAEELAAIEREEARLKAAAAKTAAASKASKTDAEADASAPKKKRGLFGGLIGGKGRTTKAKAKAAKTKGAKAKGAKAKGAKVASKEESFEFEIQNVHVAHVNLGGGAAVYVAVDNFDVRLLLFVGHGFALHGGGGLALFCIVVALTHPLPLRSTHPLRSCTAVSRSRLSPLINLILYGLFPQSTPTSTA